MTWALLALAALFVFGVFVFGWVCALYTNERDLVERRERRR